MNKLYPLKFIPIYKEKIWGGSRISQLPIYNDAPKNNCGEAWMLTCFEDNFSIIKNGFLAGNTLNEIIEIYMDELVGEEVYKIYENNFPLLIKALNSSDWLSVQVHPNDEIAAENGMLNGKTEMWYIAEAGKNSSIINGFNKKVNLQLVNNELENGNILSIMQENQVAEGDVVFLPAGTVHALGKDILLFEIQQASDCTYRLFDFNRVDNQGNKRELHINEALKAIDYNNERTFITSTTKIKNKSELIINDKAFTTIYNNFGTRIVKDYTNINSFVVIICTEGEIKLLDDNGFNETLTYGELILIPATTENLEITPKFSSSFLEVYYTNN